MNLWRRAKAPWDYADTIAALWAFAMTNGTPVSLLPNTPVANAALKTGRFVREEIANKVSEFVALSSPNPPSGSASLNALDRIAWSRFFDPVAATLDVAGIQREFERLWPVDDLPDVVAPPDPKQRAEYLEKFGLAELMTRWSHKEQQCPTAGGKPKAVRAITTSFQREPLVVAIALSRAKGRCEVPLCDHPLFADNGGKPFLEVHHIEPLGDGGEDTPENVAAICPSHHREAHHGQGAEVIRQALKIVRANAARMPPSA